MTTLTLVFNETQPGKIVINAFPADSDESTDLERIAANCSSDLIKNQIEKEAAKKGGAK